MPWAGSYATAMAADERRFSERANESLVRLVVRLKEWWRRFLRPGSLIVLGLVTLTGVGVVMREVAVPSESFWATRSFAGVTLAIVAALTYIGNLFVVVGYRHTLKSREQDTRLYAVIRDVVALVESETSLDRASIGVHVWTIRGLPGIRRLERRATFLWVNRPPSPITWRKGKGVLGQVWQRDDWILANLDERFNFTWHDARATQHYKAVIVWPLRGGPENAPKVVGCLSVDVQHAGAMDELEALWEKRRADLLAHIAVCELILRKA
jgi:hypothetical protein